MTHLQTNQEESCFQCLAIKSQFENKVLLSSTFPVFLCFPSVCSVLFSCKYLHGIWSPDSVHLMELFIAYIAPSLFLYSVIGPVLHVDFF